MTIHTKFPSVHYLEATADKHFTAKDNQTSFTAAGKKKKERKAQRIGPFMFGMWYINTNVPLEQIMSYS